MKKYDLEKFAKKYHTFADVYVAICDSLGVKDLSLKEMDELEVAWLELTGRCHLANKTYIVNFHQDVYGSISVDADNILEARRKAREILNTTGVEIDDYTYFDKHAQLCKEFDLDSWEEVK